MDLAFVEHRVDYLAGIVNRRVLQDLDRPVFPRHRHHRHMGTESVGALVQRVGAGEIQPRLGAGRQQFLVMGRRRHLREGYAAGGVAAAGGASVRQRDILGRAVQQVPGDGGQLLPRLLQYQVQRGAAGDQPAAGRGAAAGGQDRGVAVAHPHIARGDAQRIGGHLRESGFRALPVGGNPGMRFDIAVGADDDAGVVG